MCGIAAFLSTGSWRKPVDAAPFLVIADLLAQPASAETGWAAVDRALDGLAQGFPALGGFGLHRALATDPALHGRFQTMADHLEAHLKSVRAEIAAKGRTDALERTQERLADYLWQVRAEVLGTVAKVAALAPMPLAQLDMAAHFLAWGAETVLQGIDKLEVRGRDSAGIGILVALDGAEDPANGLPAELAAEFRDALAAGELAARQIAVGRTAQGVWTLRATYKVANLVGRLGDNGRALRAAITGDRVLWALASRVTSLNVLSHTRWASNGIINVPNCHPVNGRTLPASDNGDAEHAAFVMNGDVDNYATLVSASVKARGLSIDPAVSTDTKILPVVFTLETDPAQDLDERFLGVMRRCHGSFAIGLQHLAHPSRMIFGQKGSGQALYLGQVPDGLLAASEVYGIATQCRAFWPMNAGGEQGAVMSLDGEAAQPLKGQLLPGQTAWLPAVEPIQIFARDIFRGDYPTYIEKEINEAPSSIAKTLAGKYVKQDGQVTFLIQGFGNGPMLLDRLTDRAQAPIRRIIVVGQGTAAIAGMGIAHLIRRSVQPAGITVEAGTASELFGFLSDGRFDDALVVAVSQSGTTTDTNRIVDLAKARGAWIHAIVNRRNSALVQKAHSFLYTSDGRDVEMSVASTKAYYAQVAAGKLLGLLLADRLGLLPARLLLEEIEALEALAPKVQAVLDRRQSIAAIAARFAPAARNWALVGNGANRIAAQEIRIKLSELCYKAIPCDVTEDKKHIDLSTEPLTLVVANDLPEMVVSDTVKEVSIFKAHNGRPIVLCAEGENRFDPVAEAVIPLPVAGAGLDFVVATVAGHLFGIAAAQAIDQSCIPFRDLRGVLSATGSAIDRVQLAAAFETALAQIDSGITDSALAAHLVLALARHGEWVRQGGGAIDPVDPRLDALRQTLNKVIDDLTRPIDTIRHQAKTVTVGISRPQAEISPLILDALTNLNLTVSALSDRDREFLEIISPLVTGIDGALVYDLVGREGTAHEPHWIIQAVRALDQAMVSQSRYAKPETAHGSKRRAIRIDAAIAGIGRDGRETFLVLPLHSLSGSAVSGLLLLHLVVAPEASLQQKIGVLKAMGHKFDELTELVAEEIPSIPLASVLGNQTPSALIFGDVHRIVAQAKAG